MSNREFNRPPGPPRGPVVWGRVYALLGAGSLLCILWTLVAFTVAQSAFAASTMPMQFSVQGVHVTHKQIRQLRHANSAYAHLIHAYWGTPTIGWHTNGPYPLTPVIITSQRFMTNYCGQGAAACHGVDYNGVPIIVVGKAGGFAYWSLSVSHEVAETLVDPYVNRIAGPRYVEIADPVENYYFTYRHNPSSMSDFVTPAWFGLSSGGAWDLGGALSAPAPSVAPGGYDPLTGNGRTARTATASPLLARMIAMPARTKGIR